MNPTNPHIAQRRMEHAVLLLDEVEAALLKGYSADHSLARLFSQNRHFGGADRRFYTSIIFAWFRWKGLWQNQPIEDRFQAMALACWLDGHPLESVLHDRLPPELPEAPPATVPEKIEALGRCFPALMDAMPDQLLPDWVIPACSDPEGPHAELFRRQFIESIQNRPPTWIRLGSAGLSRTAQALATHLPDLQPHPVIPHAFATRCRFHLHTLQKEVASTLEIQDLASQAVGLVCAPEPGQCWWDLCAGAGGKTLLLADLMGSRGSIAATDSRPGILHNLLTRARRAGVDSGIRTALIEEVARATELFDGILVDAPCSGIGTWARNPDARWRTNPDDVTAHAGQQQILLDTAASRLRVGGRLVYSVCTLTREETSAVAQAFLQRHPNYRLAPGRHPLHGGSTDGLHWIWPWAGPCNGMFIAAFTRTV